MPAGTAGFASETWACMKPHLAEPSILFFGTISIALEVVVPRESIHLTARRRFRSTEVYCFIRLQTPPAKRVLSCSAFEGQFC